MICGYRNRVGHCDVKLAAESVGPWRLRRRCIVFGQTRVLSVRVPAVIARRTSGPYVAQDAFFDILFVPVIHADSEVMRTVGVRRIVPLQMRSCKMIVILRKLRKSSLSA